ncbi:phosphatidylglycerol lysyltransferase domain-containing protein [Paenibacillus sp. TRM 82003]|nr:phosphatidylglycerol lysyltransferase domain-containing protein [Paenibacillus sp. TRM 82003]
MTGTRSIQQTSRSARAEPTAGSSFTHLQYQGDKARFWSENHASYLLYGELFGRWVVLGDPIGPLPETRSLLREFFASAERQGKTVIFYQSSKPYADLYEQRGYRIVKTGEEAVVDLPAFHTNGKDWLKVRNRKNKLEREGFRTEVRFPPHSESMLLDIKRVSDAWLGKRDELSFSVGSHSDTFLAAHPIVTLHHPDGSLMAFLTLAEYALPSGERNVCIDLMRYRGEAPPGAMEVLFVCALSWAKENGYGACSLGVSPLAGACGRRMMRVVRRLCTALYRFEGLRHFKAKFQPVWEDRYLAHTGRSDLWAMLLLTLLVRRKPANAIRKEAAQGAAAETI